jgi:ribosomal protein L37AE/L43A
MDAYVCPKGHESSEPDYCSECGAKMQNGGVAPLPPAEAIPLPATTAQECPDCGTAREHSGVTFCEICGYNFTTGARGEVPTPVPAPLAPPVVQAPAPAAAPVVAPPSGGWSVVVAVDPSLRQPGSPDPPADVPAFTISIKDPVSLIGRKSAARAIFPEIPLDFDEAVSRRHALLQLSADGGLVLRDIGAANGTRLNGQDVQPMTDCALKDGDEITLGHWTRISVKAVS